MNKLSTTVIISLLLWLAFVDINAQQEIPQIEVQERNHTGFTSIEVSQEIEVHLFEGPEFKVTIEAYDDMLPSIRSGVSGETLQLSINDKYKRLIFQNLLVKVNVTLPKLKNINASGSSIVIGSTAFTTEDLHITVTSNAEVRFENAFSANNLNLMANSGGKFISKTKSTANTAKISAGSTGEITLNLDVESDIECSGASNGKIIMAGKASDALLSATSNSELRMKAFSVLRANVVATTSAMIGITVHEFLAATATYKANIQYWGKPKTVNGEATSGGRIR